MTAQTDGIFINGHTQEDGAPKPLHILIAGAGIGGLTTALTLRKQGHIVDVFEQSQLATELGAAVHLAPNSNGCLQKLGIIPESFGSVHGTGIWNMDAQANTLAFMDMSQVNAMWQYKWMLAHRVRLHRAIKDACLGEEGEGTPVKLHTSSRVKSFDEKTATITLADGKTFQGDAIIGADGVHSIARSVIDPNIKPFGSGHSAFRFLIRREDAVNDPATKSLTEKSNTMIIGFGKDRRIVIYPTSNNELLNFVCIHPSNESNASADWNTDASLETMLKVYDSWHSSFKAILAKADPKSLKVWELLDMDEIKVWNKDRLVLIGDAAHPFLPHQGQGAAVAIEDGVSVGTLLPLGTKPEEIPERFALYDQVRHARATRIQYVSRIMGQDGVRTDQPSEINMMEFSAYNFGHDEFDNSRQKLREFLWAKAERKNWRMPIAFGPMPGPRQTHLGLAQPRASETTFTTASARFMTSRTVLQNLFPPGRSGYRFLFPGTIAYASISSTTLGNLEWLGGTGYTFITLQIHGVAYTKEDGTTVTGCYAPVLFENLADPIISGREELGMPKVYSSIDITSSDSSYEIKTGWQGNQWGTISLSDLKEVGLDDKPAPIPMSPPPDAGVIVHRFIPSVGEGKPEADYACYLDSSKEREAMKVSRVLKASSAKINFDALTGRKLPTLHHIVQRLAEIPVWNVVDARVVSGTGGSDLSNMKRV